MVGHSKETEDQVKSTKPMDIGLGKAAVTPVVRPAQAASPPVTKWRAISDGSLIVRKPGMPIPNTSKTTKSSRTLPENIF